MQRGKRNQYLRLRRRSPREGSRRWSHISRSYVFGGDWILYRNQMKLCALSALHFQGDFKKPFQSISDRNHRGHSAAMKVLFFFIILLLIITVRTRFFAFVFLAPTNTKNSGSFGLLYNIFAWWIFIYIESQNLLCWWARERRTRESES